MSNPGAVVVMDLAAPDAARVWMASSDEATVVMKWNASTPPPASEGWRPMAGGVVHVRARPGGSRPQDAVEVHGPYLERPDDEGDGRWGYRQWADPERGAVFVLVCPTGMTVEEVSPAPAAAKAADGRVALYWRVDVAEAGFVWRLRPATRSPEAEAAALNRSRDERDASTPAVEVDGGAPSGRGLTTVAVALVVFLVYVVGVLAANAVAGGPLDGTSLATVVVAPLLLALVVAGIAKVGDLRDLFPFGGR